MYTLAEAAAACGINKTTVLRAIKSGRISGAKDELGAWHVNAAELHRVFPPAASATAGTDAAPQRAIPDAATDSLIADLRGVIADLRQDRDHWREAFQSVQRLLPTPVQRDAAVTPEPATPWRRFLRWRRSAAG